MHDRRPARSRKPTVLTRSSRSPSTEATFASAAGSRATVTTRKTAAVDSGASTLCASIGTRSQFLPDISNSLLAQTGYRDREQPRNSGGPIDRAGIFAIVILGSMLRIAPE